MRWTGPIARRDLYPFIDRVAFLPLRCDPVTAHTNRSLCRLVCFLLLLAGGIACGEGETDLLNPGSDRDQGALPDTIEGIAASADRSFRPRLQTGAFRALTIADENGLVSHAYLRFDSDALPDTAGILLGELGLRLVRASGGPFRIQAHEIAASAPAWTEEELPVEPLPLDPPFFATDGTIAPAEGETLIVAEAVRIPAEILKRWKIDPASNRGLALTLVSDRPGVLRALSKEADDDTTTADPSLEILREDAVSVVIAPSDDAYRLVDSNPPATGAEPALQIGQTVPHETLLRFDLPAEVIERGTVIHRAEILLRTVPGSIAEGDSFVVGIYRNESAWQEAAEPDTVAREALAIDIAIVKSDVDSLLFDLGPAVQRWVDGEPNDGITLRILDTGLASSAGAVASREAEAASQPRLRIVYSPPPEPRWESR